MLAVGVGAWRAATPLHSGLRTSAASSSASVTWHQALHGSQTGWLRPDGGAAVGDVVVESVPLDLDDGAHPGSVLGVGRRSRAEGLGDVARRVLDDTVRLLAEALVEDLADRVQLDLVGAVGGEVAGSAVLAGVEGGDLAVESVGLLLEVGEVVLAVTQRRRRADGVALRGRLRHSSLATDAAAARSFGLDLAAGLVERGEVG